MKLTRDRLKQIIKEELEEMMDERVPEYDQSTFENTLFSVSRILRGEGPAGVPTEALTYISKIEKEKPTYGETQLTLVKSDRDFYFKMQNNPFHPWAGLISDKQNIAKLIRKIGEEYFEKSKSSPEFAAQSEKIRAQCNNAAVYLEHLNDLVNQMSRMRKAGKEVALKFFGSQAGRQQAPASPPVQERKKR